MKWGRLHESYLAFSNLRQSRKLYLFKSFLPISSQVLFSVSSFSSIVVWIIVSLPHYCMFKSPICMTKSSQATSPVLFFLSQLVIALDYLLSSIISIFMAYPLKHPQFGITLSTCFFIAQRSKPLSMALLKMPKTYRITEAIKYQ